jgi:hypothetical protein
MLASTLPLAGPRPAAAPPGRAPFQGAVAVVRARRYVPAAPMNCAAALRCGLPSLAPSPQKGPPSCPPQPERARCWRNRTGAAASPHLCCCGGGGGGGGRREARAAGPPTAPVLRHARVAPAPPPPPCISPANGRAGRMRAWGGGGPRRNGGRRRLRGSGRSEHEACDPNIILATPSIFDHTSLRPSHHILSVRKRAHARRRRWGAADFWGGADAPGAPQSFF